MNGTVVPPSPNPPPPHPFCVTSLYLTAPDDHCRVVLKERDSTGSDYINATYIDVSDQQQSWQTPYVHTRLWCELLHSHTHTLQLPIQSQQHTFNHNRAICYTFHSTTDTLPMCHHRPTTGPMATLPHKVRTWARCYMHTFRWAIDSPRFPLQARHLIHWMTSGRWCGNTMHPSLSC